MSKLELSPGTTSLENEILPVGWTAMQMKDFCSFSQGGRLGLTKQTDYRTSGVPAFSAAGQDGFVEVAEFNDTDAVVLSAIGANCGRCFRAQGQWTTLANVQAIIPYPNKVDAQFLHYRVNRDDYWPRSGSAQPFIKPSDIKACWVAFPALAEQKIVTKVLLTLDTAINETEAIIGKLKHIKQGFLNDLLTRGVDANGELRLPQTEAPYLYKQSPLGWVPKEWQIRPIHEMGEVVTGSTPPSHDPHSWGFGVPFITPGDLDEGGITSNTERHISERGRRYVRLLPAGSSLVVCIGSTIGKVGFTSQTTCTNQQINAVVPGHGTDSVFLFHALQRLSGRLRALAGLQAVPIVNKSSFESIQMSCPTNLEQIAISHKVLAMSDRLQAEQNLLVKLRHKKIGLMGDLLTGRVRMKPLIATTSQGST